MAGSCGKGGFWLPKAERLVACVGLQFKRFLKARGEQSREKGTLARKRKGMVPWILVMRALLRVLGFGGLNLE